MTQINEIKITLRQYFLAVEHGKLQGPVSLSPILRLTAGRIGSAGILVPADSLFAPAAQLTSLRTYNEVRWLTSTQR